MISIRSDLPYQGSQKLLLKRVPNSGGGQIIHQFPSQLAKFRLGFGLNLFRRSNLLLEDSTRLIRNSVPSPWEQQQRLLRLERREGFCQFLLAQRQAECLLERYANLSNRG